MVRTIKEKIKKLATPIICGTVVFVSVGATALAASSGDLTVGMYNNQGSATLKNTSGDTRYCEVYIREYYVNPDVVYDTSAFNSGNVDNNKSIVAIAEITKTHAMGYGNIHAGATSMAPVDFTVSKIIK